MNRTPVEDALAAALNTVDTPITADDLFVSVQRAVRRRARRRLALGAAVSATAVVLTVAPIVLDAGGGEAPESESAVMADAVQVLRFGILTGGSSSVRPWSTLRGVLPNVEYAYDSGGRQMREQITDSVVVGRVVRTEPAYGMRGEPLVAGEDVRSRVVAFDDPRAAWRVLSVTVEVSETVAGTPAEELVLDWTVPGPSDRGPDAVIVGRALEELGTLVVLSKASPDRPEFVPGRAPLSSGYGVGRVAADGRLDFPLIGSQEGLSGAAFMGSITTLPELRAEAQEPTSTESITPDVP